MAREIFGSTLGSLLVMAGSAVGLGNIWRFPSMVGQHGGAAFIFIYILAVLAVGIPILLCEFIIGRRSRKDPVGAFTLLSKGNKFWVLTGRLLTTAPLCILGYYSVVGGWTIDYFVQSLLGSFSGANSMESISSMFGTLIATPWKALVYHVIFLTIAVVVVLGGVKNGIEKFSKVMMPVLFLIMIVVAIRAMFLPGAVEGLKYLFHPDFSQITPNVCVSAVGQAFFSLSLGMGTMMTYATYCSSETNIFKSSVRIAFFDLVFALIAGIAVMCSVFAFGLDTGEGTGLVFETLPMVFSKMPLGSVIAAMFFVVLVVAALTSEISIVEVCVSYMTERHSRTRKNACTVVYFIGIVLGSICVYSMKLFNFLDNLSANYLMLIGGFLTVLFTGWVLKKEDVKDEFTNHGSLKGTIFAIEYLLIKFIEPVAIFVIFVAGLVK